MNVLNDVNAPNKSVAGAAKDLSISSRGGAVGVVTVGGADELSVSSEFPLMILSNWRW